MTIAYGNATAMTCGDSLNFLWMPYYLSCCPLCETKEPGRTHLERNEISRFLVQKKWYLWPAWYWGIWLGAEGVGETQQQNPGILQTCSWQCSHTVLFRAIYFGQSETIRSPTASSNYRSQDLLEPFHYQKWSTSNFTCSLTKKITTQYEELGFS